MSGHPAVAFLLAAHKRAERLARDAEGCTTWTAEDGLFGPKVRVGDDDDPEWSRENSSSVWECDDPYDDCASARAVWRAEAQLIAGHADPVAVLRRVTAERELLAEHADDHGDCPVCSGEFEIGTSAFLGHEPWPCRTVLLLAKGWGWEEEAS